MNTKKAVLCCGFVALCVFGVVGFVMKSAQAATVTNANAFRSVSLLGQSILMTGGAKFNVVDMDGATGEYHIVLPDPASNDGLVYFVKRSGDSEWGLYIDPLNTGELEEGWLPVAGLYNRGEYKVFLADATNDTWWVVGTGAQTY